MLFSAFMWLLNKNTISKKQVLLAERLKHVRKDDLVAQSHMSLPAIIALSRIRWMSEGNLEVCKFIIKSNGIRKERQSSSVLCWDNKAAQSDRCDCV